MLSENATPVQNALSAARVLEPQGHNTQPGQPAHGRGMGLDDFKQLLPQRGGTPTTGEPAAAGGAAAGELGEVAAVV